MIDLSDLELKCNRCKHKWLRRSKKVPKACPACKTKFWNQPRVRKIKPERRAARNG